MKLHQFISEAFASSQNRLLSADQAERVVATQLRGYLLTLQETQSLDEFKNERVFGQPLLNWLLEEELFRCASTYLDLVVKFGINSLGNWQFHRDFFYHLIQTKQYNKLLRILNYFNDNHTDIMAMVFIKRDYNALFLGCLCPNALNSTYLTLLHMALAHISFTHFYESRFIQIYAVLIREEERLKSNFERVHENLGKKIDILHKVKIILEHFVKSEKENKTILQPSDTNRSSNSSPLKEKKEKNIAFPSEQLLLKAKLNIAELESLKSELSSEITQQTTLLPEKERMRKVLIFNCKQEITKKMANCATLTKKYEKTALTLRQMR